MSRRHIIPLLAAATLAATTAHAQPARVPPPATHDGAHDFDFLIGDWKAHVKRMPERLVGSTTWVEYDGRSNHHKMFGTNANLEDFEVDDPRDHLHIKAQTLRLYDPTSRQWSIYGVDLDAGTWACRADRRVRERRGTLLRLWGLEGPLGRPLRWSHTGQGEATWSRPSPPTPARPGRSTGSAS